MRPYVSALIRTSNASDSALLPTLTDYYKVNAEYESIMKECYPGSVLEGQEMLKKVANVVGLELPKTKIKGVE